MTWSYASALTAFSARNSTKYASWGASDVSLPSTCSSSGSGKTVSVSFSVDASTNEGESIYLAGSVDALKDWSPDDALKMDDSNYPTWTRMYPIPLHPFSVLPNISLSAVKVDLPASETVTYKYLKKDGSDVTWESDPNNSITTPSSGSASTNDKWQ